MAMQTQILSGGLIVRQDFRRARRFVFFDTNYEEWQYATHGGTVFIVNFQGKGYGITCSHVKKDFEWRQLVITDTQHSTQVAGLKAVYYPSNPILAAEGTDIEDITIIEFANDVTPAFFQDSAYLWNDSTIATSQNMDKLEVAGFLKSKSKITENSIKAAPCVLQMQDAPLAISDPSLRHAIGKYVEPEFDEIMGLSGAPVFNVTRNALCGMVVRGTMSDDECKIYYVDAFDIDKFLLAVHRGETYTRYTKSLG